MVMSIGKSIAFFIVIILSMFVYVKNIKKEIN